MSTDIILNDILRQGGQDSFGLFAVTPVGLTLLIAGNRMCFILLQTVFIVPRYNRHPSGNPIYHA